jgi:FHS family glucose/mannose:H+ symporter-like MFS transporter
MKSTVKGTAFVHLDFVLTGVVMALLGPMLPILSGRWSLNDTQAGYLFTVQFAASMGGMLLSGLLVRRQGYRVTLIQGLMLMGLGMAAMAQASWLLVLLSVCIFGAGFGITTPTANLFIARINPNNRAAQLNLLNSSWGVGAMSCPVLVAVAQRSGHTSHFLYGMAAALALLAAWLGLVDFARDTQPNHNGGPTPAADLTDRRFVAAVAGLFFIYVGTETCMGGWIAAYARRLDSGSRAFWAVTPSFFWGAMLLGRFFAPIALRHLREIRLAAWGVALASFGLLILLAAKTLAVVVVGATLTGFGLASIYPINVSLLTHWFGDAAARISGTVFAVGSVGGGILPWLVGVLSTRSGSLRLGFFIPWLGTLAMLGFYLTNESFRGQVLAGDVGT